MRFVNIKNIIPLVIIVILLFIIKNMIASTLELRSNSAVVSNLKAELEFEGKRNQFLTERLYYVQTDEFVKNEARKKLGLVKEGEYIVLAPPATDSGKLLLEPKSTPNWKKWWELFFESS